MRTVFDPDVLVTSY